MSGVSSLAKQGGRRYGGISLSGVLGWIRSFGSGGSAVPASSTGFVTWNGTSLTARSWNGIATTAKSWNSEPSTAVTWNQE